VRDARCPGVQKISSRPWRPAPPASLFDIAAPSPGHSRGGGWRTRSSERDRAHSGVSPSGVRLAANALRVEPIHDMPFIVLEVSSAELQRLIESGDVAAVQEDIPEKAVLAQSGPLVRAPDAWARGARGAGRAVAILDTGVDASHPFLAGRVTAEACFSTSSPSQGSTTVCPDGSNQQVGPGAGRRAA
jgi:subtilisin family serine protease